MYFQFLIEDRSTEILVDHVMNKLKKQYSEKDIFWSIRSFSGLGNLQKKGNVLEQKVYPQGLSKLKKKAGDAYTEIGKAKCEWADRIGEYLHLHDNKSPSYQYFIGELERRIAA